MGRDKMDGSKLRYIESGLRSEAVALNASTALLTKVRYTSGENTYDADYFYDDDGRLSEIEGWLTSNGNGLRYAYDDAGRLTRLTDYDNSTLDYTYDGSGNVLTLNDYHGNSTVYTYTDTGQLSTITAPGSKVWDFDYNALGQPTQYSHPNGMTTAYTYDSRNRLSKIEHKDGQTVTDSFDYDLDDMGNITRTTQADSSYWLYEYDERYRLTKAERMTAGAELAKRYAYTYDDGDNLVTKAVYTPGSGTVTSAFTCNSANEMTAMAQGGTTTNFAYDAWGRMTSKSQGGYTATYAYRYGSKLYSVSSSFPSEGNVTYNYGADQKRRSRTAGGSTTRYNWDVGWTVLNEEDGNGALTRTFVGRSLADVSGTNPVTGTWRYYFHDNLGSTRRLREANKSSLGQYEYTPYGLIYAESGLSQIPRKYTGHDPDFTTMLYFAPFRYYNPVAARWMTRDPLGMVDGVNVYAYVQSNPVTYSDEIGTTARCCVRFGIALSGRGSNRHVGPNPPAKRRCRTDELAECFFKCWVKCRQIGMVYSGVSCYALRKWYIPYIIAVYDLHCYCTCCTS
jgi:RHS repeat-associated protein